MTETVQETTVLISWASVSSLCMAIALAQEDIPFLVLDNSSQIQRKSKELVFLYPATQSLLKRVDVWDILEDYVEPVSAIHFFSKLSDTYIHSNKFKSETNTPVLVEKGRLISILLLVLEDYWYDPLAWSTIIDYKDKKHEVLCTVVSWSSQNKTVYKSKYLVLWENTDQNILNEFKNEKKEIGKFFEWYTNFPLSKLKQSQDKSTNDNSPKKPIEWPEKPTKPLKESLLDEGHLNVLIDNNTLFSLFPLWNEIYAQLVTSEDIWENKAKIFMDKALTTVAEKFWRSNPELKAIQFKERTHYTSSSMQTNNIFLIWSAANSYPEYHQTVNQGCADADNLIRKIIYDQTLATKNITGSYNDERLYSHKLDHKITNKISRRLLRAWIFWFWSWLFNRRALISKSFQQDLKVRYSWTKDEYPESTWCVEEYPTLIQMAPRNNTTDITWKDWLQFYRWPKAGFQASSGYLVLESNQPKQNRKDLITNSKHLLLIFDGTKSNNTEQITKLKNELQEEYDDFMDVYRITTTYDIQKHDWDPYVLWDDKSSFHKKYRCSKSCMYLIRPDWVIGWRSCWLLEESLHEYMKKFQS